MIKRTLASRVERLEDRLGANRQHIRYVVEFVAPGGTVVSTLTFEDGREEWWYAPGHEPNESTSPQTPISNRVEGCLNPPQMISDSFR